MAPETGNGKAPAGTGRSVIGFRFSCEVESGCLCTCVLCGSVGVGVWKWVWAWQWVLPTGFCFSLRAGPNRVSPRRRRCRRVRP